MKKTILFLSVFAFSCFAVIAQTAIKPIGINLNKQQTGLKLKENEETLFSFYLKKDNYYTILAVQEGLDIALTLKDKEGHKIQEMDSPNGKYGPELIEFSPDQDGTFVLTVKPSPGDAILKEGSYSLVVKQAPKSLQSYSYGALLQDFDLLKSAFLEMKVGLWYHNYKQFDSLCNAQKSRIKDKMNALDFYKIIAPIVAFTGEGHSAINIADETSIHIKQNGRYFPFLVKILNGKVYLTSDYNGYKTKGMLLDKINGNSIDTIMQQFLSIEPSDGYNFTSKYRWIETSFSKYYLRFFEPYAATFTIELTDPATGKKVMHPSIPSVGYKQFGALVKDESGKIPNYNFKEGATFELKPELNTAILTVNSFGADRYKNGKKGFIAYLDSTFKLIEAQKIKHLIIDVRKNEGGQQGMEDYLMSHLIEQQYAKYKYIEIPAFTYSFLAYTDYKNEDAQVEKDLGEDFYRTNDGHYIDKRNKIKGEKPSENTFKGDIYILVGGLTFSGGSEFAALAKNYTKAKFIGEEAGGGYYGNTSGKYLKYVLPNSKVKGRIPWYKYVVDINENGIPFGHGVLPDYTVQPTIAEYLIGFDAEMEFAKQLIKN